MVSALIVLGAFLSLVAVVWGFMMGVAESMSDAPSNDGTRGATGFLFFGGGLVFLGLVILGVWRARSGL